MNRSEFFDKVTGKKLKPTAAKDLVFEKYVNHSLPTPNAGARSSLATYTGTWGAQQVMHLLRRTTFGATKADLDNFVSLGMTSSVNQLLTAQVTPSPPVNDYNSATYTDPNVPAGQTWVNAAYDANLDFSRTVSWAAWWMELMTTQPLNITEKMTLFLHNHIPTSIDKAPYSKGNYQYNALLRAYALGNFKSLVKDITKNPNMLSYLNGVYSNLNAPDENYARELQELFTIGHGAGYTENDVKAAAKVLTGWRYDVSLNTYFDDTQHDSSDKQFSVFYNNTVITGQTGQNGQNELDDLLTMIFAKDEVAAFVVRKIYRWFVYYVIDTDIEANIIQPLATVFRTNNYELAPVLNALFTSQHFYDTAIMGCYIKNPLDYLVGVLRTLKINIPTTLAAKKETFLAVNDYANLIGMQVGLPPNVAGWLPYRESPGYYEFWISSTTMPKRNQVTDALTLGYGINTGTQSITFDPIAFVQQFPHPEDPVQLVDDVIQLLLPFDLSATQKLFIKAILLSGQSNNSYWTSAWNDYIASPTDQNKINIVLTRLRPFLRYITALPEYQLS